jgi:hypothetical protein
MSKTSRTGHQSETPLKTRTLHPTRRLPLEFGMKIECRTDIRQHATSIRRGAFSYIQKSCFGVPSPGADLRKRERFLRLPHAVTATTGGNQRLGETSKLDERTLSSGQRCGALGCEAPAGSWLGAACTQAAHVVTVALANKMARVIRALGWNIELSSWRHKRRVAGCRRCRKVVRRQWCNNETGRRLCSLR